jgi:CRP-like cAMP-binding protein
MWKATTADISTTWIPELTTEERATLMSYGEQSMIKENEVLIVQGQQQDMLFLLLSGELRAQASSHRSQVTLGKISPGESVGEMSVMDPFKASATIRALKDGKLWKIERAKFDQFIEDHPRAGTKVLRHLAKTMARRVRRACEHLVHQANTTYYDWD